MIGQIAQDTGWTVDYILDLNYLTLRMILADRKTYVSEKEAKRRRTQAFIRQQNKANGKPQKGFDPLEFFTKMAKK